MVLTDTRGEDVAWLPVSVLRLQDPFERQVEGGRVKAMAFTADGERLATIAVVAGRRRGEPEVPEPAVRVWDARTGSDLGRFAFDEPDRLASAPEGRRIAVAGMHDGASRIVVLDLDE